MTAKTQNPKKANPKQAKKMSLWERAQLIKPVTGLSKLLEEHELLNPVQRKQNILAAQKKGLIKAKVMI